MGRRIGIAAARAAFLAVATTGAAFVAPNLAPAQDREGAPPAPVVTPDPGAGRIVAVGAQSTGGETPVLNQILSPGTPTEDPIGAAKREVYASCLSADFPEDFARWADLNGDEILDPVFTFNVVCDGFRGAFCGAGPCPGAVFVSVEEGRFVKTSLPPEVEPREPYAGRPAVIARIYGPECGIGIASCRRVRVWNGADFVDPDVLSGRAAARPAPPPPETDSAATAEDYEATAALFFRIVGREADPQAEARIDALAAAGALRSEPGWRAFRPSAEWSYEPLGRGRARAYVEGELGFAELQIACRAGDGALGLAFISDQGVFSRGFDSGQSAAVDIEIAGRQRASLLLRFVRERDFWVARIDAEGPLSEWLRRGSAAVFREAGDGPGLPPAARFALSGSRRAIEAAYRACGLLGAVRDAAPSEEASPPVRAPVSDLQREREAAQERLDRLRRQRQRLVFPGR